MYGPNRFPTAGTLAINYITEKSNFEINKKSKKNKFNFKIIDRSNEHVKCTKSARRFCWSHPCFPIKLYFSTISYCCCSNILFYWKRLYWSICRKVSIYESHSCRKLNLDYQSKVTMMSVTIIMATKFVTNITVTLDIAFTFLKNRTAGVYPVIKAKQSWSHSSFYLQIYHLFTRKEFEWSRDS